jgi:N-methylhydantoinase A
VRVTLPATLEGGKTDVSEAMIRQAFETAYQTSFSRLLPGVPMRIVNLRTSAIGIRPGFDLKALAPPPGTTVESATTGKRQVWFDGAWHETTLYARLDLPEGAVIDGPAILEQPDATTVVAPEFTARIDAFGNVIVEWKA